MSDELENQFNIDALRTQQALKALKEESLASLRKAYKTILPLGEKWRKLSNENTDDLRLRASAGALVSTSAGIKKEFEQGSEALKAINKGILDIMKSVDLSGSIENKKEEEEELPIEKSNVIDFVKYRKERLEKL